MMGVGPGQGAGPGAREGAVALLLGIGPLVRGVVGDVEGEGMQTADGDMPSMPGCATGTADSPTCTSGYPVAPKSCKCDEGGAVGDRSCISTGLRGDGDGAGDLPSDLDLEGEVDLDLVGDGELDLGAGEGDLDMAEGDIMEGDLACLGGLGGVAAEDVHMPPAATPAPG